MTAFSTGFSIQHQTGERTIEKMVGLTRLLDNQPYVGCAGAGRGKGGGNAEGKKKKKRRGKRRGEKNRYG